MNTSHIEDVDLELYASGYPHFTSGAVDVIHAHLAQCEACAEKLERYISSAALSEETAQRADEDPGRLDRRPDRQVRENQTIPFPTARTAKWRTRAAVAAAILLSCGLLGAAELGRRHVQTLEALVRSRQETARIQAQTDELWSTFHFDEIVKPVVRVLPTESGGKPNRVRVELSPRIEEGLVRDVSISWGDSEDAWEPVYEALGTAKGFQAVHEYPLPPAGQTHQWTLRVLYAASDAAASARRLTPDQLTSACRIEATADGISLLAGPINKWAAPELAAPGNHELTWRSPLSGSEVGWKVKVTLQSPTATELVTLLIRPVSGNTFYVQPGARRLLAGTPEIFEVQLGSGPESAIGADFDILAVCGNGFAPDRWSLDLNQVPHSAVIGHITVRKAAGTIHLARSTATSPNGIGVEGEIWTSHGGALLMKEEGHYKVLKTLAASNDGNRFTEFLALKEADRQALYLLVHREGELAPQTGQTLPTLPAESWLYGCSNTPGRCATETY